MYIKEFRVTGCNQILINDYHRKLDTTANFQLNFLPSDKQVYAFDYLGSGDHGIFANNEYYPKSGSYDFRYKSVKTSQTDYVKVDFSTYRGGDKENIVFKDRYGIKLKLIDDNTLAFTASNKPDTNYIYAYDKDGVRIGKLFVYTYNQKIHNVFLVPVKSNGTQNVNLPNVEEVSRAVNKTFNQSVTSFKFQIVDPVIIPDLTTFTHGGSKLTSVFNDDQKKVLEAYDDKMNDNDFYLFFVDNVLDKFDSFGTSVAGYMPRGYNCGFIYDGGSPRTIAHELGHGVGNLEHAFEKSNTSGKTKNLMDYSDGEELYHFQWNEIQDPSRVWLKWSKEESEGELLVKRSEFDFNPYIMCILGKDTIFYSSGETIYLLKNKSYKFKVIKRHQFLNSSNQLRFFDIVFNKTEWIAADDDKIKKINPIYEYNISNNIDKITANISEDEVVTLYSEKNSSFLTQGNPSPNSNLAEFYENKKIKDLGIINFSISCPIKFIDNSQILVQFTRSKNYSGEYGFDDDFETIKSDNEKLFNNYYEIDKISNQIYNIPWLSILTGKKITIQAIVSNFTKDKSKFLTFNGDDVSIKVKNTESNQFNLNFVGTKIIDLDITINKSTGDDFSEYKSIQVNCDDEKVGIINYYSLSEMKNAKLTIIPFYINSSSFFIDKDNLGKYLNEKSFNQAFVNFTINVLENINNSDFKSNLDILKNEVEKQIKDPDFNNSDLEKLINVIDLLKSKTTSNFTTDDIFYFLKKYFYKFIKNSFDNDEYILFVTDITPINKKEDGYASVNGIYSVIFNDGSQRYSTYVHELGHCIGLNHPFENETERKPTQKSTENYMDYSYYVEPKLMFWKTDWTTIYNNIIRK